MSTITYVRELGRSPRAVLRGRLERLVSAVGLVEMSADTARDDLVHEHAGHARHLLDHAMALASVATPEQHATMAWGALTLDRLEREATGGRRGRRLAA